MWSKKRRKIKREKEKQSQPSSPSKPAVEKGNPPSGERPHPLAVDHQFNRSNSNHDPPPHAHTVKPSPVSQPGHFYPNPPLGVGKSAIKVPLPNAPLPHNTDILDSLRSSDPIGGEERTNPSSLMATSGDPDEIQKVIERQRSQIELLSQITRLVSGGSLPASSEGESTSVLPSRLASRAQTFDYANRSNKNLEEKALKELDRSYLKEDDW